MIVQETLNNNELLGLIESTKIQIEHYISETTNPAKSAEIYRNVKLLACQTIINQSNQKILEAMIYIYEQCCLIFLKEQNMEEFKTSFLLLEPLYMRFPKKITQYKLIFYAVQLIHLLAINLTGDFHVFLERLSLEDRQHPDVKVAIDLEMTLTSGNYEKAVNLLKNTCNPLLCVPAKQLIENLRQRVGACLARSHTSISIERAQQLLMIFSIEELKHFIEQNNLKTVALKKISLDDQPTRLWVLNKDTIEFVAQEEKASTISAADMINFVLGYAGELERIV